MCTNRPTEPSPRLLGPLAGWPRTGEALCRMVRGAAIRPVATSRGSESPCFTVSNGQTTHALIALLQKMGDLSRSAR